MRVCTGVSMRCRTALSVEPFSEGSERKGGVTFLWRNQLSGEEKKHWIRKDLNKLAAVT